MLPRPQTATENCTIHNYNVVPIRTGKRYVLVGGNYQAGISVVDFTDPANAEEVAYADPAPLPDAARGGAWSTYWYNGRIYESDITRGLNVWKLSDKRSGSEEARPPEPADLGVQFDSPAASRRASKEPERPPPGGRPPFS